MARNFSNKLLGQVHLFHLSDDVESPRTSVRKHQIVGPSELPRRLFFVVTQLCLIVTECNETFREERLAFKLVFFALNLSRQHLSGFARRSALSCVAGKPDVAFQYVDWNRIVSLGLTKS